MTETGNQTPDAVPAPQRDRLRDLLERSRRGDLDAFSEVVREFHGEVRGLAAMMAVAPDWIDDVAQEVFVEAFRSLGRFDPSRPFGKWLRGVARNVIRRHEEREARESRLRRDAASVLLRERAANAEDDAEIEGPSFLAALRECAARLSEPLRRMLGLRYGEGRTSAEIARELGRSAEAVRMSMMRARRLLLDCVRSRVRELPAERGEEASA